MKPGAVQRRQLAKPNDGVTTVRALTRMPRSDLVIHTCWDVKALSTCTQHS